MYGDGLITRSARYTSSARAPCAVSEKRCDSTTWNASPARMYSLTRSTAAMKSSWVNDDTGGAGSACSPRRGGSSSGSGRRGARSRATMSSMRAHARS